MLYPEVVPSTLVTISAVVPFGPETILAVAPLSATYDVEFDPEEEVMPSIRLFVQLAPPKYVHSINANNNITKSSKISSFIV